MQRRRGFISEHGKHGTNEIYCGDHRYLGFFRKAQQAKASDDDDIEINLWKN